MTTMRDANFVSNWKEIVSGFLKLGATAYGGPAIMETAGPMNLTTVDPERYGSLSHPGDTYSFDMYAQAGAVALHAGQSHEATLDLQRLLELDELLGDGVHQRLTGPHRD